MANISTGCIYDNYNNYTNSHHLCSVIMFLLYMGFCTQINTHVCLIFAPPRKQIGLCLSDIKLCRLQHLCNINKDASFSCNAVLPSFSRGVVICTSCANCFCKSGKCKPPSIPPSLPSSLHSLSLSLSLSL